MSIVSDLDQLKLSIEELFDEKPPTYSDTERQLFADFLALLNRGEIRSAEPDVSQPTGWRVNTWVKKGILLGFRMGTVTEIASGAAPGQFFDKSTFPLKTFSVENGVRIVPGGSSVRTAATSGAV